MGLKTKRLKRQALRIEGATWPAVPDGRVSLQRQIAQRPAGASSARHGSPLLDGGRSRYRFTASRRRSRATNYRVVVLARNGGANVPGTSRTITVPER